jgi:Sulfotransferase family
MNSPSISFVACPSYHGATLLSLILNNHSELAALGDTLPERQHMDYFCSCGERIENCDFWTELAQVTGAEAFAQEATLLPLRPRLVRHELANKLLNRLVHGERFISRSAYGLVAGRFEQYQSTFDLFAGAACDLLGKKHFIDGTKYLHRLFVLAKTRPERTINCIHLLRDPRGFVLSCKNNLTEAWDLKKSAREWRHYHYRTLQLCTELPNIRHLSIRYEDLCDSPEEQIQRILGFLGVRNEELLTAPRPPHHIIGNRMLREFHGGIEKDEKWRTVLGQGEQADILRVASPYADVFRYSETWPEH